MSKKNDYYSSIHRLGRISTLVAIALMFSVPLFTTLYYDVNLDWPVIAGAAAQLCIVFIPTQLTEVLSFAPVLGSGGTYLSFITGNVSNMKLPAAAAAHRQAGVDPTSDKGEVISVLAIGASSITTTVIVFLGMFALTPFIVYLENPILQPGFANIMPALIGAMAMPYLMKKAKLVIVPAAMALIAGIIWTSAQYSSYQGYLLLATMIISVLSVILVNKRKADQAELE